MSTSNYYHNGMMHIVKDMINAPAADDRRDFVTLRLIFITQLV